jgi:Protein-L-isoaspartate(D-aspartate) O-methyltransferase (PCMT)
LDLLSDCVGTSGEVVGIEREERFAEMARKEIKRRELNNVSVILSDALGTGLKKESGQYDEAFRLGGGNGATGRMLPWLLKAAGVRNVQTKVHVRTVEVGESRRTHHLSMLEADSRAGEMPRRPYGIKDIMRISWWIHRMESSASGTFRTRVL